MNLYIKMEKIGKYFFRVLKGKEKGWQAMAYFSFFILIYDFVLLIYILFIGSVFSSSLDFFEYIILFFYLFLIYYSSNFL